MAFYIASCAPQAPGPERAAPASAYIKQITEYTPQEKTADELMEKYGAQNMTQEEIQKIINSIKWETNDNVSILGSAEAKKGGTVTMAQSSYPPTIRPVGEASNTAFNSTFSALMYETLTGIDPITLQTTPGFADKWSVSEDQKTYFFHINPKAKWHDGRAVTAFDYAATYDLMVHPDINDPFQNDYWQKYERPAALTKSIVMIKAKELEWRLFMSAGSSLIVLPEHVIGRMPVKEFMEKYHTEPVLGSGPYYMDRAAVNREISFRRFDKWWAENLPEAQGMYNFDRVRFLFFTDEQVIDESLKKGDIDVSYVRVARKWAEDFTAQNERIIKNNWLIRRRVYNDAPSGMSGIMFNFREEPFNDIRVRKAFAHLVNREKMMERLFYNEYDYMDSFFPNSVYENPYNPKVRFDFMKAIKLLEEAGWKQSSLNRDGYMVKDGKVFELNLNIVSDDSRVETIIQQDLAQAGIKLNLRKVTWAAHIKDLDERNFNIISIAYTGLLFPNPENSFHSRFADLPNTNNLWGFKNKRVDELCEKYNVEFDINKRIEMAREIDGILTQNFLSALYWYSGNVRVLHWNKFGMPSFVLSRFDRDSISSVIAYWWLDEEKEEDLQKARSGNSALPAEPEEILHWRQ